MIVSNKTRSLLTYVTHVCYLYMILYLDIVIAKFILSLLLLQTLAAFLASFKMLSQGQCLLSHLNKLPQVAICSLSYQFVRDFNSMKAKIEVNESCKCHKAKLTWNTTAVGFKARRESSVIMDNTMMSINVCVYSLHRKHQQPTHTHCTSMISNVNAITGRFYSLC